jgi:MFS family permease
VLRERTFRSMTRRNFRLFTAGNVVSVIGTWMQRIAQDWLVYDLTDSAVALSISLALQFLPTLLFGLWGGVLVDRRNRWRIIVVTQVLSGLLAAVLGVLTVAGVVQLWMVYALTLALGIVTVVDNPARQAFVAQMVDHDDYVNAQSLTSTVNNAGRLVGPALAGLVIGAVGVGPTFLVNALSFVGVLVGLLRMDRSQLHAVTLLERGPGQIREGLRYVGSRPVLLQVMVLVLAVGLFGQNFRVVLPVLAEETFGSGAEVYGYLMTVLGAGAIVGSLVTASRRTVTDWAVLLSCLAFGFINLLAAGAPNLPLAYVAMFALGYANISFNSLARTVLQTCSERSMHGRVLGLHSLAFLGTTPLGAPVIGWICDVMGARSGFLVSGVSAVVPALVLVLVPSVRRRRRRGAVT